MEHIESQARRRSPSRTATTWFLRAAISILVVACASTPQTGTPSSASPTSPATTQPAVSTPTTVMPEPPETSSVPTTQPTPIKLPVGAETVELDPAGFTTEIDNPYWPMTPGTRWIYRETSASGSVLQVEVVVTNLTKQIANGITARVVRDTVSRDGAIVEDTFDWYAQDSAGNIWYLGEDTAEFENGQLVSRAGSFEAGVDGAQAGIALPADPVVGMRYRQEYYRGQAEDNGEVLSIGEQVDIAFGSFHEVLLTADTSTIEPGVLEQKYYARGIGLVLVRDVNGGGGEELISMDMVDPGYATGPLGNPNP